MKTSTSSLQQYADEYQRRRRALPGQRAPWLLARRDAAIGRAIEMGLPTRKNEAWKYTSLQPLADSLFPLAEEISPIDADQISGFLLDNAYRLVFIDGIFAPNLSNLDDLPSRVQITSLAALLDAEPDQVKTWLGDLTSGNEHVGVALNSALLKDGAFVRIGQDVVLNKPLQLLYVGACTGVNNTIRNVFVADPGSRAAIFESYYSVTDGAYFTNTVSEVFIGEHATIEITKLVCENSRAIHLSGHYCTLQHGATLRHHNVDLGATLVRNDLRVNLNAPAANVQLNGLHTTRDRQHVDNQVFVNHQAAQCTSRQLYKGILAGNSRGVFAGRVVVQAGAQQTDAQQANHNLLLSKEAEANSKPQLEIYADDVKCAHGATVGHLDEEAMFYLRSRGIGMDAAHTALIQAFAREVIERIGDIPARERVWREIEGSYLLRTTEGKPLG